MVEIIGVDVTSEQIERAEAAKIAFGLTNVCFLEGDLGAVSGNFLFVMAKPRLFLRKRAEIHQGDDGAVHPGNPDLADPRGLG